MSKIHALLRRTEAFLQSFRGSVTTGCQPDHVLMTNGGGKIVAVGHVGYSIIRFNMWFSSLGYEVKLMWLTFVFKLFLWGLSFSELHSV